MSCLVCGAGRGKDTVAEDDEYDEVEAVDESAVLDSAS